MGVGRLRCCCPLEWTFVAIWGDSCSLSLSLSLSWWNFAASAQFSSSFLERSAVSIGSPFLIISKRRLKTKEKENLINYGFQISYVRTRLKAPVKIIQWQSHTFSLPIYCFNWRIYLFGRMWGGGTCEHILLLLWRQYYL